VKIENISLVQIVLFLLGIMLFAFAFGYGAAYDTANSNAQKELDMYKEEVCSNNIGGFDYNDINWNFTTK